MEKRMKFGYTKAIDEKTKTVTGLVSTNDWDRTSEKFVQGAWDLKNFLQNPVVLWGHDSYSPPIGKCVSISDGPGGLEAVTQFNEKDDRAMQIFQLYADGYLKAFSVGFLPRQFKMEDLGDGSGDRGLVFTDAELLEYSCVSIPANPGAIVGGKRAEAVLKALGNDALEQLKLDHEVLWMAPIGPARQAKRQEILREAKPDIESTVKYLRELAKTVKGKQLPGQQIALFKNAIEIVQEIIPSEPQPEVTSEQVAALGDCVKSLLTAAHDLAGKGPDADEDALSRLMTQLDKALERGPAA